MKGWPQSMARYFGLIFTLSQSQDVSDPGPQWLSGHADFATDTPMAAVLKSIILSISRIPLLKRWQS